MQMKKISECSWGEKVSVYLMVNKITDKKEHLIWAYCGDKNKEIQCVLGCDEEMLVPGDVILAKGRYAEPFKPEEFEKVQGFDIKDFLPCVKRPIEEIMRDIEKMSNEEFKSEEACILNDYFFKNSHFLDKFKRAIGGVYNHHNYLGGLAEHTLGVMYLTKVMADRYNARYKEIAILGAKLHDIGKVYEMNYDGPFTYTLKGKMQGHIVMGVTMVEKAFFKNEGKFSEEFKERIKGIIVQHHGNLEYGSPVQPRSEESYIVHYADYVDATMNKIKIIEENVPRGQWSKYDNRIKERLFL